MLDGFLFFYPRMAPEAVWGAYESLVQAGFDQYVIREAQTRTE